MIDTELCETSDVARDAHRLLERNGWPCSRVIDVDRDSILYLNSQGAAHTAWIYRDPHRARETVRVVLGFIAEPPANWYLGAVPAEPEAAA